MINTLAQKIEASPFRNIYWFARHLLNTDQYGALGKSKEHQLLELVSVTEGHLVNASLTEEEKYQVAKHTLLEGIRKLSKPQSKAELQTLNLVALLDQELDCLENISVFCITMRHVVAPINQALLRVPSNDEAFCKQTAASILDTLGETKAGTVISTWDTMGVRGCLDAERAIVVEAFSHLMDSLSTIQLPHDGIDDALLLTAFVQEFERRLGQKRKARGGTSLESVVSFLFDYYHFKSTDAPSHFDQDLEVDKWFKCFDGWTIGISCKRTLRERWKQLSQADRGTLSHFKIKELWHLITYDRDLSDDKIVRLGEQGQIFYLMDSSETYQHCAIHPGMKDYVRPLSRLISDIRKNVKKP